MIIATVYDKINGKEFDKTFYDVNKFICFYYRCLHGYKLIVLGYICSDSDELDYLSRKGI